MSVEPTSNPDVYCYLKSVLEPDYRVTAEPCNSYFSQWLFCYQIYRDRTLVEELSGDFRVCPAGSLVERAKEIVQRLSPGQSHCLTTDSSAAELPFASRLPPRRDDHTWFSSGRSAFAYLMKHVVRPRRLFLPSFVCWSLIDVMLSAFSDVKLCFYSVDRKLNCHYPEDLSDDDAIVAIHYFGHRNRFPDVTVPITLLSDESHLHLNTECPLTAHAGYRFGSLRKAYRVADGGYIRGVFNPTYTASRNLDGWLRLRSRDWRDMREAENMTDRSWSISDISSQSLAVVLKTDEHSAAAGRKSNNRFLGHNFGAGTALMDFRTDETPLLHCRTFSSREERDSLRSFLAARGIFTSIHWPAHSHLRKHRDQIDCEDAIWLAEHSLAIPVSEDFRISHMEQVCSAVRNWNAAGAARFVSRPAG